jgi:hypothetical protein
MILRRLSVSIAGRILLDLLGIATLRLPPILLAAAGVIAIFGFLLRSHD